MKNRVLFFLLLFMQIVSATTQRPLPPSREFSSLLTDGNVKIISQKLRVKIDAYFHTAKYFIEYTIEAKKDLNNQYFLFVDTRSSPREYNTIQEDIKVWIDNDLVEVKNEIAEVNKDLDIYKFIKRKEKYTYEYEYNYITFDCEDKRVRNTFEIRQLSGFNTNISKGVHKIQMEVRAESSETRSKLRNASFIYWIPSPLQQKDDISFELVVEQEGETTYVINLEETEIASSLKTWKLEKTPKNYISIKLIPKPSIFAQFLLILTPFGISLFPTILFIRIHYKSICSFRRENFDSKYSTPVVFGSIIMPVLGYLAFLLGDSFIDSALGIYKGLTDEGFFYAVIIVLVYPIVLPIYWILAWVVDRWYKKKLQIEYAFREKQ